MNIKIRIFIPVIVVAILVAVAMLASNVMQFSRYITDDLFEHLQKISSSIHGKIENLELKTQVAALFFSHSHTVSQAMETSDTEALISRAEQLYKNTGIILYAITDASGWTILRQRFPGDDGVYASGDSVSFLSMYLVSEALAGRSSTSIEYSLINGFMTAAGAPIFNAQGELLGAVVVGFRFDTNEFVDRQKNIFNCEVSIMRGGRKIATTMRPEDGMQITCKLAQYDAIEAVLKRGEIYSVRTIMSNRDMLAVFSPVKNPQGYLLGALFTGYFFDEKMNLMDTFIARGILLVLVILGISIPIILFAVGKISSPIISLVDKAYQDALTGVYNWRYLDEELKNIVQNLSRSGSVLSVMMIDIDMFKRYNDTYGHNEGDNCLKIVAETLRKIATRTSDFVARYGGEEFLVVLPNTGKSGACIVAERMLESIWNCHIPHESSNVADRVTISIGVTTGKVEPFQTAEAYIKRADELLYKSKANGRNRYTYEDFEGKAGAV